MKRGRLILLGLLSALFLAFGWEDTRLASPLFKQPALITSAGQSAEVQLASVLAKRAGLQYTLSKTAVRSDLAEKKTLVLVLGASLKGLGAAGLDISKEKDRVAGLIEESHAKNIPILCLHLGGESRRGQLSDEFIAEYLPSAKMAIVVKSGNKDGLFSKICEENNILIVEVERTAAVLEPLKKAFM